MVRFILCVAAIWGGALFFGLTGRVTMPFALRLAVCITLYVVIRGDNEKYAKKLINFGKRFLYHEKLQWMFGYQSGFAKIKRHKERYDAVDEVLTEDTIRQWILDEMQQEVWRQGFDMVFMFSGAEEAEKRLKRIVETSDRFTSEDVETYLREDYPHRCAEMVAREFFPMLCIGEPTDIIMFFPQNIRKKWRMYDFDQTFNPRCVVKGLVRHEVRHYMQNREMRRIGGSAFVERIQRRRMWLPYGVDVTESDAFRCQFGNERGIEKFLEEAIIEAA